MTKIKVYKRELREFLEEKRKEALQKVSDKYEILVREQAVKDNDKTVKLFKGEVGIIEKIAKKLKEGTEDIKNDGWKTPEVKQIVSRLETCVGSINSQRLTYGILPSKEVEQLERDEIDALAAINLEYNKIDGYITGVSPSKGYEYLLSLGFKCEHLNVAGTDMVTALVPDINIDVLGINKEEK